MVIVGMCAFCRRGKRAPVEKEWLLRDWGELRPKHANSMVSTAYSCFRFLLARSLCDPLPEYAAVCSVFALKQAKLVFAAFHILQRWTSF